MPFRMSSSVTSPKPMSRMPELFSSRPANCRIRTEPTPEGTKAKNASRAASRARCREGAKSGFCSGARRLSTTCPPASANRVLSQVSASMPGPWSVTSVASLRTPSRAAHSARTVVVCETVTEVRAMEGGCSVTAAVAAAMTTCGTFARGDRGRRQGEGREPEAGQEAHLLVHRQFLRRTPGGASATPPPSLRTTSIGWPATDPWLARMQRRAAASIWRPVDRNGPVIGRIGPILIGPRAPCARAPPPPASGTPAASAEKSLRRPRIAGVSFPERPRCAGLAFAAVALRAPGPDPVYSLDAVRREGDAARRRR